MELSSAAPIGHSHGSKDGQMASLTMDVPTYLSTYDDRCVEDQDDAGFLLDVEGRKVRFLACFSNMAWSNDEKE